MWRWVQLQTAQLAKIDIYLCYGDMIQINSCHAPCMFEVQLAKITVMLTLLQSAVNGLCVYEYILIWSLEPEAVLSV